MITSNSSESPAETLELEVDKFEEVNQVFDGWTLSRKLKGPIGPIRYY